MTLLFADGKGFHALGLNHSTAPVRIREQAVFFASQLAEPLAGIRQLPEVDAAVLISTCNRTEAYWLGKAGRDEPEAWLHRHFALDKDALRPYLYHHADAAAVRHLFRVCSGLDSMVLGESEVLAQMKKHLASARDLGAVDAQLGHLFEHAFAVARSVRRQTAIGAGVLSLPSMAVRLARQVFSDLGRCAALFIGSGDMTRQGLAHFREAGFASLSIANRSADKVADLGRHFAAKTLTLSEIEPNLPQVDVILSSISVSDPLLQKPALEAAMRARRQRPLLIVDLGVPPNVAADAAEVDGVFVYGFDDLQQLIEQHLDQRGSEAQRAELLIDGCVADYPRVWRRSQAASLLRGYREAVEGMEKHLVEQGLQRIAAGVEPEQALELLARSARQVFAAVAGVDSGRDDRACPYEDRQSKPWRSSCAALAAGEDAAAALARFGRGATRFWAHGPTVSLARLAEEDWPRAEARADELVAALRRALKTGIEPLMAGAAAPAESPPPAPKPGQKSPEQKSPGQKSPEQKSPKQKPRPGAKPQALDGRSPGPTLGPPAKRAGSL